MELVMMSRKYNAAVCQNDRTNNYIDPQSGDLCSSSSPLSNSHTDPCPSVSHPGHRIIGSWTEVCMHHQIHFSHLTLSRRMNLTRIGHPHLCPNVLCHLVVQLLAC